MIFRFVKTDVAAKYIAPFIQLSIPKSHARAEGANSPADYRSGIFPLIFQAGQETKE